MRPHVVHLTRADAEFQRLEALMGSRQHRHRERLFVVEGVRALNAALAADWPVAAFIHAEGAVLSEWAQRLLAAGAAQTRYVLTPTLMEQLSARQHTSELLALLAVPPDDPTRIELSKNRLALVFDRPTNKGNLGTVIRSVDAFAADGLVVLGHAVDVYDPETARATVGSLFRVPVVRMAGPSDVGRWLGTWRGKLPDLCVVAATPDATIPLSAAPLSGPTVFVVGNEAEGLSLAMRRLADAVVQIPMAGGSADSLNVAAAASICLYEATRQRAPHG